MIPSGTCGPPGRGDTPSVPGAPRRRPAAAGHGGTSAQAVTYRRRTAGRAPPRRPAFRRRDSPRARRDCRTSGRESKVILPYGWETPTGSPMPTSSPLVPYGGEELPYTPVRRHGGNQDERVEGVPRRGRVEVRHQDVPCLVPVLALRRGGAGGAGLQQILVRAADALGEQLGGLGGNARPGPVVVRKDMKDGGGVGGGPSVRAVPERTPVPGRTHPVGEHQGTVDRSSANDGASSTPWSDASKRSSGFADRRLRIFTMCTLWNSGRSRTCAATASAPGPTPSEGGRAGGTPAEGRPRMVARPPDRPTPRAGP